MNIQATSSPGLPSLRSTGSLIEKQVAREIDKQFKAGVASASPELSRPTRLIGRTDLHATFVYTNAAEPQPALTGRQVDVYV